MVGWGTDPVGWEAGQLDPHTKRGAGLHLTLGRSAYREGCVSPSSLCLAQALGVRL